MLLVLCLPMLQCCKKDNETDKYMIYREIVWNYLSEQDKATVSIDWENAEVIETVYAGWPQAKGEELYPVPAFAVIFKTSNDALLGPITIYINPETNSVLGVGLRD